MTDTATSAPASTSPATGCPTCVLGLHHCHGLVVRHDDATWFCLDGCGGPLAVHDDVVDCAQFGLGCCHESPVVDEAGHPPGTLEQAA